MATKPKIYVSLTTIPARVPGIEACIRSLHEQTHRPEAIFLCVPHQYRTHGKAVEIPAELQERYPLLNVVHCEEDDGPGTKLLGSMHLIDPDPETLVVILDDDSTYRDYMLEEFARAFQADPGHAYSFFVFKYRGIFVGQGCDGLAIPSQKLSGLRDHFGKIRDNEYARLVDDLWISHFLQMSGSRVLSLRRRIREGRFKKGTIYHIYNEANALRRLEGRYKRWKCMSETRKLLKQEFKF